MSISLRECIAGEEYQSNGKCKKCEANDYYLLEAPNKPTFCKECQKDKSQCLGGNEVYPLPNFWRSSNMSDDFLSCRNEVACL